MHSQQIIMNRAAGVDSSMECYDSLSDAATGGVEMFTLGCKVPYTVPVSYSMNIYEVLVQ